MFAEEYEGNGYVFFDGEKAYKVFYKKLFDSSEYGLKEKSMMISMSPHAPEVFDFIKGEGFSIEVMEAVSHRRTKIDFLPNYLKRWLLGNSLNELIETFIKANNMPRVDCQIYWDRKKKKLCILDLGTCRTLDDGKSDDDRRKEIRQVLVQLQSVKQKSKIK